MAAAPSAGLRQIKCGGCAGCGGCADAWPARWAPTAAPLSALAKAAKRPHSGTLATGAKRGGWTLRAGDVKLEWRPNAMNDATATATATHQAQDWLTRFDQALQRPDLDAAVALFGDDCYWSDLVSFTWSTCTQENPAQVKEPARRRQLAQPLQEPVPARPGLVRPPAVPGISRRLASFHAQGQAR